MKEREGEQQKNAITDRVKEKIGAHGSIRRKEAISRISADWNAEQLNVISVCLSHNHISFP